MAASSETKILGHGRSQLRAVTVDYYSLLRSSVSRPAEIPSGLRFPALRGHCGRVADPGALSRPRETSRRGEDLHNRGGRREHLASPGLERPRAQAIVVAHGQPQHRHFRLA